MHSVDKVSLLALFELSETPMNIFLHLLGPIMALIYNTLGFPSLRLRDASTDN